MEDIRLALKTIAGLNDLEIAAVIAGNFSRVALWPVIRFQMYFQLSLGRFPFTQGILLHSLSSLDRTFVARGTCSNQIGLRPFTVGGRAGVNLSQPFASGTRRHLVRVILEFSGIRPEHLNRSLSNQSAEYLSFKPIVKKVQ